MRVLILGGRAPVALDHARRFGAQGWGVFVADSASCRLSTWSSAVRGGIRLPPPRYELDAFAKAIARIIDERQIDLVLPTCEEVFYVSRIRDRLPKSCSIFAAPFEQLRELHSKWTFLGLARGCGVDVPRSARVDGLDAARDWACGRGVVLKPEFSRFGVHVRIYPEGLPVMCDPLPKVGPWVVQEFHAGTELCSYSVAVAGQLRAHIAYDPRYRLARSSSYYFDPIVEPRIEEFVARFVTRIGFTGQISFDWIRQQDGGLTVIECNPRAISGLHLFGPSDRLPAVIAGEAVERILPVDAAPRMVAAIMLSAGLRAALHTASIERWHADWNRACDVLSVPGDRWCAFGALRDLAYFAQRAVRRRCSMRAATTRDIEWDGEPLCP